GGMPPPAILDRVLVLDAVRLQVVPRPAVGAVMDGRDFAELERVEHEAVVAVRGKPHAVVLIGGLVAVAAFGGVAAALDDCGEALAMGLAGGWAVEIRRYVETRLRLKVEVSMITPW